MEDLDILALLKSQEEDNEDDKSPYDSIFNRKPLQDLSLEGRAQEAMSQGDPSRAPAEVGTNTGSLSDILQGLKEANQPQPGRASMPSPQPSGMPPQDPPQGGSPELAALSQKLGAETQGMTPAIPTPLTDTLPAVQDALNQLMKGKGSGAPQKAAPRQAVARVIKSRVAPTSPSSPSAPQATPQGASQGNNIPQMNGMDPALLEQLTRSPDALPPTGHGANVWEALAPLARGALPPESVHPFFQNLSNQQIADNKLASDSSDRRSKIAQFLMKQQNDIARDKASNDVSRQNNQDTNATSRLNNRDNNVVKKQIASTSDKNRDDKLSRMNISTANSLFKDSSLTKEVNKLNAARSAQTLIKAIRSGEITDSKNIVNQLTTIMTTIEMGGPGAHQDRQAMGVDTLYGDIKGALTYLSGQPMSALPSRFIDQIEKEAHALGDRAAKNYSALTNSALAGGDLSRGNPDIDPGQVHTLASQRRNKLLQENGYNENGDPLQKESQTPKKPPAQGVPQIGFEKGGYRFKGGDPGDKNNWEKIQ